MSIPTRRRVLTILAATAGLPLLGLRGTLAAETPSPLRRWSGVALGADAQLVINHPDPAEADALIRASLAEVARLESMFSLYRPDSQLNRLNRDGVLADPPSDLVALLAEALSIARLTHGAFDPTVQPLWTLYADHFGKPGAEPAGPPMAALRRALASVGHAHVSVTADRVALNRPGMALTLNGIAQGYVTDRVVALLKARGVAHTLVDMGEIRAVGHHPAGRPWTAGIKVPGEDEHTLLTLPLVDQALSTSGAYGTLFEPTGRFNHLFDPATGTCSDPSMSISVRAPTATLADALSTAFSIMPPEGVKRVLAQLPDCQAWRAHANGATAALA
ncbi:twin-arginine translocation pathway signal [Nitrospirillum viridazoti Y2]|uniref:FAD:protein FMN transferase n=1 Tax=Nitrospirillum amazonense TaxID=28077 RepID=A0A560IKB9_9PROT|nr:FAD:protein FMN transferase [Nitrospirillum amazonense]EGY00404.1 twin-arginine translocation pathway signal [Nitrospirillum amazonense Y2]TWB59493.1 thiamine biosynthesis lipoprotein [Nitrospirillum amazonense]